MNFFRDESKQKYAVGDMETADQPPILTNLFFSWNSFAACSGLYMLGNNTFHV